MSTKSLNILVVDDDVSLSLFLKKVIVSGGHTAFVAANTKQAEEILRKEKIDIIFCDLVLPGADGSNIIKAVKKNTPETYCVLISGYYNVSFDNYKVLAGADMVIGKPISKEALDSILREYSSLHPSA